MSFYGSILKPIAFRFDPEFVHERALALLARGLISAKRYDDGILRQELFGLTFPNPLGLAAGFDKNGVAVDHWHRLGFGFVEVGTVTKLAQEGNAKPRMFRLPDERALINRLGFNNDGSEALAARLKGAHPQIPIGINLGKSKLTSLEDASEDYAFSYRALCEDGAYFVVNVSSPNTPGLRSLQEKGRLIEILTAMKEIDSSRPILVKVSPDLELAALDDLVDVAIQQRISGLIATNTTISREDLKADPAQDGGLSGAPLRRRSSEMLRHLYRQCPREMALIGVGGIMDGDDLYDRIAMGATLCQTYTGLVYGGPSFVPIALRRLAKRMTAEGMTSLAQLRGTKA
jgi:dihydroorotate dehydrogenase